MPLAKPNQELRRELKALGLDIEQAADEVLRITKDCRDVDPIAVLKLIAKLYEDADRVAALADEVRDGVIVRGGRLSRWSVGICSDRRELAGQYAGKAGIELDGLYLGRYIVRIHNSQRCHC